MLFLTSATGGGHLAAVTAVAEALERRYPGEYRVVIHDPLPPPVTRGYGPLIRYAPWLWGLLYRVGDSRPVARLVHAAVTRVSVRPLAETVAAVRPALIVSFHPLTGQLAIRARDAAGLRAPVVTVITDLGPPHAVWTWPKADRIVSAATVGVPVAPRLTDEAPDAAERAARRRLLGHPDARFLVVLVGGAEGAGKLARRAAAIVDRLPDVDVAVICGRNRLVFRRLSRLSARYGGRLSAHGFVTDISGWLRAADVVATKAGPATIAEAACCGTAMVLTCHLPGQERNNVGFVTEAGAGSYLPRTSQLVAGIGQLRTDATALAAMRAAAARIARPDAADQIAAQLVRIAAPTPAGGGRWLAPRGGPPPWPRPPRRAPRSSGSPGRAVGNPTAGSGCRCCPPATPRWGSASARCRRRRSA
jgi:1,2-diacylglycerol 3-beta-galactosyltransferase